MKTIGYWPESGHSQIKCLVISGKYPATMSIVYIFQMSIIRDSKTTQRDNRLIRWRLTGRPNGDHVEDSTWNHLVDKCRSSCCQIDNAYPSLVDAQVTLSNRWIESSTSGNWPSLVKTPLAWGAIVMVSKDSLIAQLAANPVHKESILIQVSDPRIVLRANR
jgi:hypothetical protein